MVAAFLLVNKVYSPQYALWLLPLAVLARPRWRDFLIWQAAEAVYWLAIWMHLAGSLTGGAGRFYDLAVFAHIGGTLWLAVMVIRDILRPEHDPVRQTGDDDPLFPWADDDDLDPVPAPCSRSSPGMTAPTGAAEPAETGAADRSSEQPTAEEPDERWLADRAPAIARGRPRGTGHLGAEPDRGVRRPRR